jgi:hypothetical protein
MTLGVRAIFLFNLKGWDYIFIADQDSQAYAEMLV